MGNRRPVNGAFHLDDLIGIKEAAKLCKRTPMTLKTWEKDGILIPVWTTTFAGRIYSKTEVLEFLKKNALKLRA